MPVAALQPLLVLAVAGDAHHDGSNQSQTGGRDRRSGGGALDIVARVGRYVE